MTSTWKSWVKEWKEAWELLKWTSKEYKETERETLKQELNRQWLSTKAQNIILKNLENYNSKSETDYGWISWFVKSVWDRIESSFNQFKDIYDQVKKDIFSPWSTEQVPKKLRNLTSVKNDINEELNAEYRKAKDLIWDENLMYNNNMWNIVEMHVSLNQIIEKVKKSVKVSENVCNKQANWLWTCSYKKN
jgi:hypothetical protein